MVCLLMLLVALMLGASAAQTALQGEKAARNDRDRQFALEAAEAALNDAELDIERSPRSHLFSDDEPLGFVEGCGLGGGELGLCVHAAPEMAPVWQTIDLVGEEGHARSIPYGYFTGRALQTGEGLLPARPPRYIIEPVPYNLELPHGRRVLYLYRITAIGFGLNASTQVVLQTFYRKFGESDDKEIVPKGRLSWREISNWKELHDAYVKG